jgi:uncharacterized repeat protein (TIGR03806 family)
MKVYHLFIPLIALLITSCQTDEFSDAANGQTSVPNFLSELNVYQGSMADLIPNPEFLTYELGSPLFTDYAEKQRLIKLPEGTQMKKIDNGLPHFPEGTIIVKTFYYFLNKTEPSLGKNIVETRVLIKNKDSWSVGDYLWNKNQTEATLITNGVNTLVNYINDLGEKKVIAYHVPSNRECATCHSNNESITPIGPSIRNLNTKIKNDFGLEDQIEILQNLGFLNEFDHSTIDSMPNYKNTNISLDKRARAYFDINCGHCHTEGGIAQKTNLLLDYDQSLFSSNIVQKKDDIISNLQSGTMPFIGTTELDEKGIELIVEYLNTL